MKKVVLSILLFFITFFSFSQEVFKILDTTKNYKTTVDKIEKILEKSGRVRGTGYKQYERWKYETQFHLNDKGEILPSDYDQTQYTQSQSILVDNTQWEELGPSEWNRTSGWNPGVGRITSITVHPLDSNIIYIGSPGGGVWKTINGGLTWTPLTDNYNNYQIIFSVAVDKNNTNIVYAGTSSGALIKSIDGGLTWTQISRGSNGQISRILINPTNSNIIFITAGNGIHRTLDGGITWTAVYPTQNIPIEDIKYHPTNTNIMYATSSFSPSVLRSDNGGTTCTPLSSLNGIVFNARSLIGTSPNNPNRVYIIQAYGNEFGRLYISDDAGLNFTTSVIGSPSTCTNYFGYETSGCGTGGQAGYDMAIEVNPENANEIYIGGINVWRSNDGGKSFTALTQWSLPTTSYGYVHADIHALVISKKTLYVGSDGGIYKKITNGWQDLTKGMGIRQFYKTSIFKNLYQGGSQDNGSSFYTNKWYDWLGGDGGDNLFINETTFIGSSQYGTLYRTTDGGQSFTTLNKPANGEWITPIDYKNGKLYAGWNGVYYSTNLGNTWTKINSPITTTLTTLKVEGRFIYASRSTTLWVSQDSGSTWNNYLLPSTINSISVSPTNPSEIYVSMNSVSNRVYKSLDAGATFTDISSGLPAIIVRTLSYNNDTLYAGLNIGVFRYTGSWTNITGNLPLTSVNDLDVNSGYLHAGTYGRGLWRLKISESIVIVETCNPPSNLISSNITSNSVNLKWGQVVGSNGYQLEYKPQSSTQWTILNLNDTTYSLTNLNPSTIYDWRVKSICNTTQSNYSQSQFTTSVLYYMDNPLLSITRSGSTHRLTWATNTNDNILRVDLSQSVNSGVYNIINTSYSKDGNFNVLNTLPNTTYSYRVNVIGSNFNKTSNIVTIKNPRNITRKGSEILIESYKPQPFSIIDVSGRVIYNGMLRSGINSIPLDLKIGVYFLRYGGEVIKFTNL